MRSWNTDIFSHELYNLITHKNILDVVESLIGSEIIHHGDFHLRPKLPGHQSTAFPWHQDSQYYGKPTQYMHVVTLSLPLVEVTEANGCIWVIPSSHHWGYSTAKGAMIKTSVPSKMLKNAANHWLYRCLWVMDYF